MYSFTRLFSFIFTHLGAQVAAAIPLPGPARFLALAAPEACKARKSCRIRLHFGPSPIARLLATAGKALQPAVKALPSEGKTARAAYFLPAGEQAPTAKQCAYYHALLTRHGITSASYLLGAGQPESFIYLTRYEASKAIAALLHALEVEARVKEQKAAALRMESLFIAREKVARDRATSTAACAAFEALFT